MRIVARSLVKGQVTQYAGAVGASVRAETYASPHHLGSSQNQHDTHNAKDNQQTIVPASNACLFSPVPNHNRNA